MAQSMLSCCFMEGPVGRLQLVASERGLRGVFFAEHRHMPTFEAEHDEEHAILTAARRELSEYFAGESDTFHTPLEPFGGTPFQRTVWDGLRNIPCGETWSYRQLAAMIGHPSAVRAVGAANGKNPLSIFVPCHRVVGASGALTGYAGGLAWKRWLLAHEVSVRTARRVTHDTSARVRLDAAAAPP